MRKIGLKVIKAINAEMPLTAFMAQVALMAQVPFGIFARKITLRGFPIGPIRKSLDQNASSYSYVNHLLLYLFDSLLNKLSNQ